MAETPLPPLEAAMLNDPEFADGFAQIEAIYGDALL